MHHRAFILSLPLLLLTAAVADDASKETVLYDEAKEKDFDKPDAKAAPAVRFTKPGVYLVLGTGIDAIDDVDAFTFEVTGDQKFAFCLIGDAAEFKKLHSVAADGKTKELFFASTNPRMGRPRNIDLKDLAPGKYLVEMYFGPQAAIGPWSVKSAVGQKDLGDSFCVEPKELSTAERRKDVKWPGAISIYHGHNWGDDKAYITAIKEAGYGATGAAEWQIDDCTKAGLKSFVFIWPHEVGTIPAKHKDNRNVLCYYLSDRISPSQWASWASMEKMAVRAAASQPAIFTMAARLRGWDQF